MNLDPQHRLYMKKIKRKGGERENEMNKEKREAVRGG
jgi:hypothetical protein